MKKINALKQAAAEYEEGGLHPPYFFLKSRAKS